MSGNLNDRKIKTLLPGEKNSFHHDGNGLYLCVLKSGTKSWKYKYTINGKSKQASLGFYPELSLKAARALVSEYSPRVKRGEDPFQKEKTSTTFREVSEDWLEHSVKPHRTPGHTRTIQGRLNLHILPFIGDMEIGNIEPSDILPVLRRIADGGHLETASRVKGIIGQILRYGVAQGLCRRDSTADLKGATPLPAKKNYPFISDPGRLGQLLCDIHGYHGSFVVRTALKILAHTFLRPGELRLAEWSEINLDKAEWLIPACRMKKKREHIVPLSCQVVGFFREIHPLTGNQKHVFVVTRHQKPISDMTLLSGLRRLGYSKDEIVAHGFRHTASTSLHEMGFESHVIEAQLAHADNSVRGVYNKAQYLPARTALMQSWSDYLDKLRTTKRPDPYQKDT